MAGVRREEIAKRVARAADILQIRNLLGRRPSELSGGQRQRVAIGRALVREADVFLFDEPLSNLDAKLRAELRVEIKKLHQQIGSTMIYVTHDQIEALTLADRIAVMHHGVIQQLAPPKEIYAKPVSRFVAEFVGSPAMNFLSGRLANADGKPAILLADGTDVSLDGYDFKGPLTAGRPIALGLRPEQLSLKPRRPGASTVRLTASLVEPMGADTLLWGTTGGQALSARADQAEGPSVGDAFEAHFLPKDVSVFDGESGARV
jgi:multiple sugar transport system ATP-binding protein